MQDLHPSPLRPVQSLVDIIDEDGDIRIHGTGCIVRHQTELASLRVGERGDPSVIHDFPKPKYSAVLLNGGAQVMDNQVGDDSLDTHAAIHSRTGLSRN